MSAGSLCPLSQSREPNVAHAIVENQIIGDEWRPHRRAVDLAGAVPRFRGIDERPDVVELRAISDNRD